MVRAVEAIVIVLVLVGALFVFGFFGSGLLGGTEPSDVPTRFRFTFDSCTLAATGGKEVNLTINGAAFIDTKILGITDERTTAETFAVSPFATGVVRLEIDTWGIDHQTTFSPPDIEGFSNVTIPQTCV